MEQKVAFESRADPRRGFLSSWELDKAMFCALFNNGFDWLMHKLEDVAVSGVQLNIILLQGLEYTGDIVMAQFSESVQLIATLVRQEPV